MGTRWNVSNGKYILIWHDKWLPIEPPFKLSSPNMGENRPAFVSQFMDVENRKWKIDKIYCLFNENEAKIVLSTPIVSPQFEDSLRWPLHREIGISLYSPKAKSS
ncbi:hypothetical protein J1N35_039008 [Gossypium stocksii]|uniref:Uncharacterized protein n=1 Tax=Gossypium stocksii TaxID=47602 RepID=A0A9D3UPX8_9ROSI|nr:hypothetical protein J1N35_039008 [Gossypium stocksii]